MGKLEKKKNPPQTKFKTKKRRGGNAKTRLKSGVNAVKGSALRALAARAELAELAGWLGNGEIFGLSKEEAKVRVLH